MHYGVVWFCFIKIFRTFDSPLTSRFAETNIVLSFSNLMTRVYLPLSDTTGLLMVNV